MAQQWQTLAKDMIDRLLIMAKFGSCLHITTNYFFSSTLVYGPSMLPTLNLAGDVVVAEHVSHRLGRLARGDLVLVRSPGDPTRIVTKRVVGIGGDRVSFFVNDRSFGESHRTALVPKGHVWIQGDNLYASHDSRHYGSVPYGLILGKVLFRVWPPDSFGRLDKD